MITSVKLYSDGACEGNPGPGGYASIIVVTTDSGKVAEKGISQGFKLTTNNRMELMGIISGLMELTKPCKVDVYTDSKYIVDSINKGWLKSWIKSNWKKGTVKNIDLWEKMIQLMNYHTLTFHWVKGHAGNKYNEMCDKMAVNARLNFGNLKEDTNYVYMQ